MVLEVAMRIAFRLIILSIFIVSAGCRTNSETPESPWEGTPDTGAPPLSTPQPGSPTQGVNMIPNTPAFSNMESLIDLSKNDLAHRLSVLVTEINVVDAKPVVWPDSSLGCPQAEMEYAQVLTPGYRIVLEHGGITFEYHTGRGTHIVTCENPSPPVPGIPGNT
jgi:hypothetical protein